MSSPEDEGRRSVGIAKEQLAATIAIPGPIGKPFGGALGQSPKLKSQLFLKELRHGLFGMSPTAPSRRFHLTGKNNVQRVSRDPSPLLDISPFPSRAFAV